MRKLTLTALAILLFAIVAVAQDNSKVAELYKSKCAKCHGADGTPTAGGKKLGAKDITDPEVMKASDAERAQITKNGKNKMPAYGKSLSDDQIKELIAYISSLAKERGTK